MLYCKGIIVSANPLFPLEFSSIKGLEWASPQHLYELSAQNGKFIPLKDSFTFEEVAKMNFSEYLKANFFQNSLLSLIIFVIFGLTFRLFCFYNTTNSVCSIFIFTYLKFIIFTMNIIK